ncbi:MAG TPA: DnaJ domain-containing protein [Fimbriimonadaceae bacterium]|nr:DnaJ domain-containing protein [Fimbriimonadaceae bacterium]
MKTLTTHYETLGVEPNADLETVRKAYRRLASRHHPDVSTDPRAHENMARINEAFTTLSDETLRMEYDAALAGGSFAGDSVGESPRRKRRANPTPIVVRLTHRLSGHQTPVYAVTFDPENNRIISSGFDNELIWWNTEAECPFRRSKIEAGVISTLRAFPNDHLVAAGSSETTLTFWHLRGPVVETWRTSNEEWVSALAISPDGSKLATGSLYNQMGTWNTKSGHGLYRRREHSDAVTAVAWSADGELVASGGADATVKLFHAGTGAVLQTMHSVRSTVTAMAFSPDNQFLAVAAVDLSIRVFSLADGKMVKMLFGHTKPIESLAFHPNGWLFATASRDGTVGLWNAAKGIGNVRIECSTRPISSVAFSSDGTMLAAGGQDKLVRVWEVTAKQPAA